MVPKEGRTEGLAEQSLEVEEEHQGVWERQRPVVRENLHPTCKGSRRLRPFGHHQICAIWACRQRTALRVVVERHRHRSRHDLCLRHQEQGEQHHREASSCQARAAPP